MYVCIYIYVDIYTFIKNKTFISKQVIFWVLRNFQRLNKITKRIKSINLESN